MKRGYLYIVGLLVCLTSSCKEDENILFRHIYTHEIVMVPATNTGLTIHTPMDNIQTEIDQILRDNAITVDDISTIRTRSVKVIPLSRLVSFSMVQRFELNIFEQGFQFEFLPIADIVPLINEDVGDIDLLPGLPNVKEYLMEDFFGLDLAYRLRRPMSESLVCAVRVEFEAVGY